MAEVQTDPLSLEVFQERIKETHSEGRPIGTVARYLQRLRNLYPGNDPLDRRCRGHLLKGEFPKAYEPVYEAAVQAEKTRRAAMEYTIAADFGMPDFGRGMSISFEETFDRIKELPGGEEMIALARQIVDDHGEEW